MMFRRAAALLPILALLAGPAPAVEQPDYKAPDKNWTKGPVGWIMTPEEEKDFKKLKTDEERAAFAKTFWEKRDPTPGTPENEYQALFWRKVGEADKTFKSTIRIGSMTDFGRVFLLLGPFTKSDKDARGYQTWIFEPNDLTGIKRRLELRFAPNPNDPRGFLLLDRKELEQYVAAHPETLGIGWTIPAPPAIAGGDIPQIGAAPARKPEEDLSPESRRQIPILEAVLAKGSGPTDVPFQVTYDFYAAVDGTTLVVVTVEAPRDAAHGSGDVGLRPFARLVPASGDGKPLNLTGDLPFVPAPTGDGPPASFVYQARHNLPPGPCTIAVVVEDKVVAGQMGTLVQTVEVPDYRSNDPALSSVSLLASFRQIEAGLGPDEEEHGAGPYVLGSFRLIPRAVPTLQKGEAFTFYYQVYHPSPDPAGGRLNIETTATFYLKDGATWKRYRPPVVRTLRGQVDLYSIDLKDLLSPTQKLPAEFKMELKVVDKPSGKEMKREIPFSVR